MNDQDQNNSSLLNALVTDVINEIPLEARVSIADLDEDEIRVLEVVQGKYLKYRLDQLTELGNDELLKECRERSGDKSMDDAGASVFILKQIWKQLRETHRLRVIK